MQSQSKCTNLNEVSYFDVYVMARIEIFLSTLLFYFNLWYLAEIIKNRWPNNRYTIIDQLNQEVNEEGKYDSFIENNKNKNKSANNDNSNSNGGQLQIVNYSIKKELYFDFIFMCDGAPYKNIRGANSCQTNNVIKPRHAPSSLDMMFIQSQITEDVCFVYEFYIPLVSAKHTSIT